MKTKEQRRKWRRTYYLKHREYILGHNRAYQKTPEGREARLRAMSKYNKTNSAKSSKNRYKLKDVYRKSQLRYNLSLKGRISSKVRKHKRRNRCKNAEGIITKKLLQCVYEDNIKKYGTLTCILCDMPICFGDDSLEHRIPLVRGGSNLYENLGISHKKCNQCKGTRTVEEYKNKGEAIWKRN